MEGKSSMNDETGAPVTSAVGSLRDEQALGWREPTRRRAARPRDTASRPERHLGAQPLSQAQHTRQPTRLAEQVDTVRSLVQGVLLTGPLDCQQRAAVLELAQAIATLLDECDR
jgi:hypothetical protein